MRNLPSKQQRQIVNSLSALLRLAVALDRRQIGGVKRVRCEYHPEVQEFHLQLTPSQPNDDCALELWSLDYKKAPFEAEFGVKLIATLEPAAVAIS